MIKKEESTKDEEEKLNERDRKTQERKPDLWSVFDRDPPCGGQREGREMLIIVKLWIWTHTPPWIRTLPQTRTPTQQNRTSQTRQKTTSTPSAQHSRPAKKP